MCYCSCFELIECTLISLDEKHIIIPNNAHMGRGVWPLERIILLALPISFCMLANCCHLICPSLLCRPPVPDPDIWWVDQVNAGQLQPGSEYQRFPPRNLRLERNHSSPVVNCLWSQDFLQTLSRSREGNRRSDCFNLIRIKNG